MDATEGCVRKANLDCKNGTYVFLLRNACKYQYKCLSNILILNDVSAGPVENFLLQQFLPISNLKLADTSNATVDMSLSLDECKVKCLSNCWCTAYALVDVCNGGSGCIIWTNELTDLKVLTNDANGQDLYVRLATIDLTVEEINTSFHDSSNQGFVSGNDLEHSRGSDLELPLVDLNTVAFATDNFSVANKLGEGGFGPVFKGKLGNGQEIAVKRLAKTSVQGMVEFKNEVLLITKLQQRYLVRLLSCCIEGEERILIYEYMPNKSLDNFLFEKSKDQVLDWQTHFKIIMGIARGVLYLHQDSRLRIIHRDLKASSILLDEAMNPKTSDFGMARIFCADEAVGNTMKVVGTFEYMSPEYAMDGIFSQKSDVFSFGVIVLEIITGKKNRGVYLAVPHTNLFDHVWTLWKEGISWQLVDESMGSYYSMNEVMRCIKVGLLCVQNHPEVRPFMSSVLFILSGNNTPLPNPKEPGLESSSSKANPSSSYDMSVTLVEASCSPSSEDNNIDAVACYCCRVTSHGYPIERKQEDPVAVAVDFDEDHDADKALMIVVAA
ncbi:putative serine/threonine-protein kinase receptor [Dioscorea cayenensis subsp. rotundata]|uniref:non-specific serine/threonine protein kinase n=1 Tax=Dioscorea cayennensis subsp. rotundata TaxID=55577 RepID=A0AB40ALK7_DIOCR|nr:putative serine/threonine-protein kinase receptor [Dioscorea cayenensis subsp. rotundata]